jgi:hypothetical protein
MITKLVAKYLYRKMVSSAKQKAGMTVYHGPWLGILLEPHPSLGGPESEFLLPIPEFRKIPSEKRQKKRMECLLKNRNRNVRFRNSGNLCK